MASLDSLSDGEIRSKLLDLGCEVGPVTPTTRKLYQKKLQNILEKGDGVDASSQDAPNPEDIFKNRKKSPTAGSRSARKSPARAADTHPLASSTLVDNIVHQPAMKNPLSEAPKLRDTTPSERKVTSSTALPSEDFRPNLPTYNGSSKFNSPPYLASPSNFRYKVSDFDLDQPYASDFTRRLSNSSLTRIAAQTSPRNPLSNSKIYDSVKESDDEEENSGPVYSTRYGSSTRGSMQRRGSGQAYSPGGGWLGRDASVYILGFLALFFLIVAYLYIHMHHDTAVTPRAPELSYPRCTGFNQNCIPEHELAKATTVYKLLSAELLDMATKKPCSDGDMPSLCMEEASRVVNMKDSSLSVYELDSYIQYAGILANSNPSKNVIFSNQDGFKLRELPSSMFCSVVVHTLTLSVWAFKIGICLFVVLLIYPAVKWWMMRKSKHQDEVLKMFSQIIEVVSSSSSHEGHGFSVVSHVRDRLISAADKSSKMKVWDEAVSLLEADSRVRKEVQQVEGEDFLVWRWLAPPPNPKKKMWQGQAFGTKDGSVNSLPESPTPCLKIRHMFDPSQEEGDNWVSVVSDAILEKCRDASIYHIVVDKDSPEGCVYVKCASPRDAGIAFKALHGSWFDSKLVTVRYIREARYLERFPDSARAKYPIAPSLNKRLN